MAGRTTAFVLVGEFGAGPFRAREWKARHGIALIEKHLRAWMPTPIAHGSEARTPLDAVYLPPGRSPAEELVVVVAATAVYDAAVMELLREEGLVRSLGGRDFDVADWLSVSDERLDGPPVSKAVVEAAVAAIEGRARLGVVRMEEWSQLDRDSVLWLRAQGLDVDEFALQPVPGAAEG